MEEKPYSLKAPQSSVRPHVRAVVTVISKGSCDSWERPRSSSWTYAGDGGRRIHRWSGDRNNRIDKHTERARLVSVATLLDACKKDQGRWRLDWNDLSRREREMMAVCIMSLDAPLRTKGKMTPEEQSYFQHMISKQAAPDWLNKKQAAPGSYCRSLRLYSARRKDFCVLVARKPQGQQSSNGRSCVGICW